MIENLRDIKYGDTLADWIAGEIKELEVDATGLFGIIAIGRNLFQLSGPQLEEWLRAYLLGIMRAGARPVIGGGWKGLYPWVVQPQYGSTPEEITDAVVKEWLAAGEDPDAGGLWFATPQIYNQTR